MAIPLGSPLLTYLGTAIIECFDEGKNIFHASLEHYSNIFPSLFPDLYINLLDVQIRLSEVTGLLLKVESMRSMGNITQRMMDFTGVAEA